MKFENTQVFGWKAAIMGMRNPMMSRKNSDSVFEIMKMGHDPLIGNDDMKLMQRLIKAGNEHCKFMRMIHVQVDWYATRSLWAEIDTYHYNTKNSESTMHRLLNNPEPITMDMFEIDKRQYILMSKVIEELENMRQVYRTTNNGLEQNDLLQMAKKILPEGFIQMRTVDTNYAEIRNMYFQRRNHRLPEWNKDFVKWVESLPYAKELITIE